jgi:hypothetical protein
VREGIRRKKGKEETGGKRKGKRGEGRNEGK